MAGLYIHIPFCDSRCAYCDFYSTVAAAPLMRGSHNSHGGKPSGAYIDALKREMTARRRFLADDRLDTIYVGGGTPTTLSPEALQRLLDHAAGLWDCSALQEVTLEANPEDLTEDYLARLCSIWNDSACHPDGDRKSAGNRSVAFNRLSIGIQSFDDGLLRLMNRRHTAERAREAVKSAQRAGFDNISIDLIWGIPGMTPAQWDHSLDQATDLGVQHISAYHLTIEPGTAFGRMAMSPIADDESERQFAVLRRKLADAGFEHYEISNFALPGRRAIHNSAYWSGRPYLGAGPSAHSFDGNRRREWVDSDVKKYIEVFGSEQGGCPDSSSAGIYGGETLTDTDIRNERIMTSLRTDSGVACCELQITNRELRVAVDKLVSEGLLVRRGDRMAIPPEKFLLSDHVIAQLFE